MSIARFWRIVGFVMLTVVGISFLGLLIESIFLHDWKLTALGLSFFMIILMMMVAIREHTDQLQATNRQLRDTVRQWHRAYHELKDQSQTPRKRPPAIKGPPPEARPARLSRRGRKPESTENKQKMVAAWHAVQHKMTQEVFCQQYGTTPATLRRYINEMAQEQERATPSAVDTTVTQQ